MPTTDSRPPIRLVVTDLDGTLWERPDQVHPRTIEGLRRLDRLGIPLLVATGRRVRSTRAPLAELGMAPPAIVLNGGIGLFLDSGERFHRVAYSTAEATAVVQTFLDHGLEPCIYVDDEARPTWVGDRPSTHPEHVASFGTDLGRGDLLTVAAEQTVLAFGVLGIGQEEARAVGSALAAHATPHVGADRQYDGFSVTVAPPGGSKWNGIVAYCQRIGIDPADTLVVGDGPNDLEMLAGAGVAVVPEDGHPDARRHADHVVGRAADGGWIEVLDLLG